MAGKTFSQKPADIARRWILIDARDASLGRLSTVIASYLTGKYKPTYTPHVDNGDYVVVVNASELVVTGDKETDKIYYSYSGFPGGLKEAQLKDLRAKSPASIIEHAVKGMLPKTTLGRKQGMKLKVYTGAEHPHAAQNPVKIELED